MEWLVGLFKWERPIARLEYFLSSIGWGLVSSVLLGISFPLYSVADFLFYTLAFLVIIASLYVGFLLVAKRIWDLTEDLKTGMWGSFIFIVLCAIPFLGAVAGLVGALMLLFCPSGQFSKQ